MPSLWFVVPAHGRVELARICLKQLRRTCDALTAEGIHATAVVIADDENLLTAAALGFAVVERDNAATSRKFNDGIQLALDPRHNPKPADYVVPCGSDDWVDHRLFLDLPDQRTMVGFPRLAIVREDGQEITARTITTPGGCGIRIWPRALLKPLAYRPGDHDRQRACDTSILRNVSQHWEHRLRIEHRYLHEFQIVDWKSPGEQLNPYDTLRVFRGELRGDPFEALQGAYPDEALEEMAALYARRRGLVAA